MIIAFGEPTHGTLKITEIRIEFFKQLVKNNLVRVFILEENYGICDLIDKYINSKINKIKPYLEEFLSLNWRSKAFLNLIKWMKKYNSQTNKPLRFFGIDCMSRAPYCPERIGKQYSKVSQLEYWPEGANLRDKYMFENLTRLYKKYGSLFFWAHSGHLNREPYDKDFKSMGEYLAKRYHKKYVAISGSFKKGKVRVKTISGTKVVHIESRIQNSITVSGFNEGEVFSLKKNLFDYVYEIPRESPLSWNFKK